MRSSGKLKDTSVSNQAQLLAYSKDPSKAENVMRLLKNGIDPDVPVSKYGDNAVSLSKGIVDCRKMFFQNLFEALLIASRDGTVDKVKNLGYVLKRLGILDQVALTMCLHIAAENERVSVMELLFNEFDVEVNWQAPHSGLTSLHCAARKNKVESALYLVLQRKVDSSVVSSANIMTAAAMTTNRIVKTLAECDSQLLQKNYDLEKNQLLSLFSTFSALNAVRKYSTIEALEDYVDTDDGDSNPVGFHHFSSFGFKESDDNMTREQILPFMEEIYYSVATRGYENEPLFVSFTITDSSGIRSHIYTLTVVQNVSGDNHDEGPVLTSIGIQIRNPTKQFSFFRDLLKSLLCKPSEIDSDSEFDDLEAEFVEYEEEDTRGNYKISDTWENIPLIINTACKSEKNENMRVFSSIVPSLLPKVDESCIDILWNCLPVDEILKIHASLLTGQSVLIVSDEIHLLHPVCEALLMLLYPLVWNNVYVPLLPVRIIEMIQSPIPFLAGMNAHHLALLQAGEHLTTITIVKLGIYGKTKGNVIIPISPLLPQNATESEEYSVEEYKDSSSHHPSKIHRYLMRNLPKDTKDIYTSENSRSPLSGLRSSSLVSSHSVSSSKYSSSSRSSNKTTNDATTDDVLNAKIIERKTMKVRKIFLDAMITLIGGLFLECCDGGVLDLKIFLPSVDEQQRLFLILLTQTQTWECILNEFPNRTLKKPQKSTAADSGLSSFENQINLITKLRLDKFAELCEKDLSFPIVSFLGTRPISTFSSFGHALSPPIGYIYSGNKFYATAVILKQSVGGAFSQKEQFDRIPADELFKHYGKRVWIRLGSQILDEENEDERETIIAEYMVCILGFSSKLQKSESITKRHLSNAVGNWCQGVVGSDFKLI